jgi:hypothetical protein
MLSLSSGEKTLVKSLRSPANSTLKSHKESKESDRFHILEANSSKHDQLKNRRSNSPTSTKNRNPCEQVPNIKNGGISVVLDGHSDYSKFGLSAHTKFAIRVHSGWSQTIVKRRFSEFVELDRQLRPEMTSLPDLPPKGYLKKWVSSMMNDRSFMIERKQGLGELLAAIVSLDPSLRNPELREFLGVASCPIDGR